MIVLNERGGRDEFLLMGPLRTADMGEGSIAKPLHGYSQLLP